MNCTVCGKPHRKEQPLTIAHNNEFLCPGCLNELDQFSRPTGKSGRIVTIDDPSYTVGYGGQVQLQPFKKPTVHELEWIKQQEELHNDLLTVFRIPPELLDGENYNAH